MLNEFIADLLAIHSNLNDTLDKRYKKLRLLLNRYVLIQTKNDGVSYPNAAARLENLMKRCELPPTHRIRINSFRVKTNKDNIHSYSYKEEEYITELYAIYALIQRIDGIKIEQQLFEEVFKIKVPKKEFVAKIKEKQSREINKQVIPVRIDSIDPDDDFTLYVIRDDEDDQKMAVSLDEDSRYLRDLPQGIALNLIFLHKAVPVQGEEDAFARYTPDIIVVEPNYLFDISSLAECYKPYGHDPMNYTYSRLTQVGNTRHILLGNVANYFLDELINESEEEPVCYIDVMKRLFRYSPFEFSTCEDLNDPAVERQFFIDCKAQFDLIARMVREDFLNPNYGIDRSKAILEPSFLCHSLGLQGRLDLLLDDYSKFIELKSGKAMEYDGKITHRENHFVQMMLYFAVLTFNAGMDSNDIQAYLMYSKHGYLYPEKPYWRLVRESIQLRNKIVINELQVSMENSTEYTHQFLNTINPDNLNRQQLSGRFWEIYLRPPILEFAEKLTEMSPEERAYTDRLYTFISKELYLSKVGGSASHDSNRGSSMLWESLWEEKVESGEILYDLELTDSYIENNIHFLELQIPDYDGELLPNFRTGDVVILYPRMKPEDNVTNNQIQKASILQISESKIVLRLRNIQKHAELFSSRLKYAMEHDFMDVGYTSMYKGIAAFINARSDRKQLLLQGAPYRKELVCESNEQETDLDRIVRKVQQANDYFLLVGPPGTGKTSQALRRMVEHYHSHTDESILLLSFTNRAVDEICQMLSTFDSLEYVRISSESACEPEYQDHLLENFLDGCNNRKQVKDKLEKCRIYVGTVSSLSSKNALFGIKHFGIAMIDEATQLLEPQLLTLLCAKDKTGRSAIDKFVLIGDHKQLPAVLLQSDKDSEIKDPALRALGFSNLKESLFERLYRKAITEEDEIHLDMLVRTGRMHPEVADFPNRFFYEGKLQPIPLPHQSEDLCFTYRSDDKLTEALAESRVAFFHADPDPEATSVKTNRNEARIIAKIVKQLQTLHRGSEIPFDIHEQIGIITPYRSQIALIRQQLAEAGIEDTGRMMIDTVERFQGSQRDIIIYSFCINRYYQFDFLCNTIEENGYLIDRKLNVAMTRARKQLFLVGNSKILRRNELYCELIKTFKEIFFIQPD
ncbi:MAG: DEAD/DEAH box helicase [Bacteroidales bacterium]